MNPSNYQTWTLLGLIFMLVLFLPIVQLLDESFFDTPPETIEQFLASHSSSHINFNVNVPKKSNVNGLNVFPTNTNTTVSPEPFSDDTDDNKPSLSSNSKKSAHWSRFPSEFSQFSSKPASSSVPIPDEVVKKTILNQSRIRLTPALLNSGFIDQDGDEEQLVNNKEEVTVSVRNVTGTTTVTIVLPETDLETTSREPHRRKHKTEPSTVSSTINVDPQFNFQPTDAVLIQVETTTVKLTLDSNQIASNILISNPERGVEFDGVAAVFTSKTTSTMCRKNSQMSSVNVGNGGAVWSGQQPRQWPSRFYNSNNYNNANFGPSGRATFMGLKNSNIRPNSGFNNWPWMFPGLYW